jgi:hypothetical protein
MRYMLGEHFRKGKLNSVGKTVFEPVASQWSRPAQPPLHSTYTTTIPT